MARVFPALEIVKSSKTDRVELVNQTIVEEVLQELGVLDFGKGITADANVSIWRERGTHHALCGEFAFQAKFKQRVMSTTRRSTAVSNSSSRCSSPVTTGCFSAPPRPDWFIG